MERLQVKNSYVTFTQEEQKKRTEKGLTLDVLLTYSRVKKDFDGWVKAEDYLPEDFDLVLLKIDNGIKKGWWAGNKWDGLRYYEGEEVKFWKKTKVDL